MKAHRSGRLFTLLALAVLFLAACQPAAVVTTNPPTEPVGVVTQPGAADTEAPAPITTETTVVVENTAPVEPTEVLSTDVPSGEGSVLPPTGMQVPEDWPVFTDSSKGYTLAHPSEWEVCEEHQYSSIFCEIQDEPVGLGPPLRVYVSVFPQDYTNADFEVYNFIPIETIREYMALLVGESMLRYPEAVLPEYVSYTRLPDRMVAGWSALVIENSKVWEFPPETKDRLVIIVTESTNYVIGMYYETPQQLEMFEQVLDSFQFVP